MIDTGRQFWIDLLRIADHQNSFMKAGFGARVAQVRDQLGLTQDRLAQRLTEAGIECAGRATVSAWEKERNPMPLVALAWLCEAAGVSSDYVLYERELAARNAFESQLITLIRGIDHDAQQTILATLNTIHRGQNPSSAASKANPFPSAKPPTAVGS